MKRKTGPDPLTFVQRVGVVATALISTGGIVAWISSMLWGQATRPIMDRIEAIQASQRNGDSTLVQMVRQTREISYRQRIDMLDVLGYPPGPARDKRIEAIREQAKEER